MLLWLFFSFFFFFLFDCCFSLVMSCNWFPHGSSEHNADCTVPQIWAPSSCLMWPHSWRLEDVLCELRPNRDAAETGSSAGGMRGGGLEWDLSGQITKSGPRVFWQAAECEIYRISTSVVQLPLCLYQCSVGYWLWEKTTGLDEWSAVIQMLCFARFLYKTPQCG